MSTVQVVARLDANLYKNVCIKVRHTKKIETGRGDSFPQNHVELFFSFRTPNPLFLCSLTQYAHNVVLTSIRRRFSVMDVVYTSKRRRVLTGKWLCVQRLRLELKLYLFYFYMMETKSMA